MNVQHIGVQGMVTGAGPNPQVTAGVSSPQGAVPLEEFKLYRAEVQAALLANPANAAPLVAEKLARFHRHQKRVDDLTDVSKSRSSGRQRGPAHLHPGAARDQDVAGDAGARQVLQEAMGVAREVGHFAVEAALMVKLANGMSNIMDKLMRAQ